MSKIVLFNAYLGFLLSRTVYQFPDQICYSDTLSGGLAPSCPYNALEARIKEFLRLEHHWEEEVPGEAALHVGHRHTGQHHLVHPGHGVVAELQVLEL